VSVTTIPFVEPKVIHSPFSGYPIRPRIQERVQNGYLVKEAIYIEPSTGEFFRKGVISMTPIEDPKKKVVTEGNFHDNSNMDKSSDLLQKIKSFDDDLLVAYSETLGDGGGVGNGRGEPGINWAIDNLGPILANWLLEFRCTPEELKQALLRENEECCKDDVEDYPEDGQEQKDIYIRIITSAIDRVAKLNRRDLQRLAAKDF
jgi:hypothetical protein